MDVNTLKVQIRELMKDMTRNGFELRLEKRLNRQVELHHARVEILKSIAHKQGLIIELLEAQNKFADRRNVA